MKDAPPSTTRRKQLPPPKRGPNGERLCRWCGESVPKPRREWCSDECVHDYMSRNDPQYQRYKVEQRDKGVCALCGLDTLRLERVLDRVRRMCSNGWHLRFLEELLPVHRRPSWWESRGLEPPSRYTLNDEARRAALDRVMRLIGKPGAKVPRYHRTLWEADHITPVAEGGGQTGLENLRTACIWCHKEETAKLVKRLARRRRPQLDLPGMCEGE